MHRLPLPAVLPGVLAVLAAAALALWIRSDGNPLVAARVPGLDREPLFPPLPEEPISVPEPGQPRVFDGKPSALGGEWPGFRGPNRDGVAPSGIRLARRFPPQGPRVLWQVRMLGPGHAGAAVAGGRVFVLDYDVAAEADTLRCFSLDDGREIWRNSYPVVVEENHGRSRTVPAVFEDCVITLGPKCHVASWDVATGRCRWIVDLVAKYHAKVPPWYAGQCPLVDQGRLILAPAGEAFMVALEPRSGKVLWQTPRLANWDMTHVSVVPLDFAGRHMYVYCASGGVAGISAEDGLPVWQTTAWVGKMATCPSPVPVGDGRVFFCSGYSAGSMMLQLVERQGRLEPQVLWRLKPRQFESEQHTPVFYQGYLYGVRTAAGGEQLVCLDLEGKELWNSGRQKFGRGPYLVADGLILALSDRGELTLAEATPKAFRPLARFQVLGDAVDAWAPMALVGGRLILRDLTRMVCIDLAEHE